MAASFQTAFRAERSVSTNGHRSPRTPLLVSAGRFLGKHLPRWQMIRTTVMAVAGFFLMATALFMVDPRLGIGSGGVFLLILEALGGDGRRGT